MSYGIAKQSKWLQNINRLKLCPTLSMQGKMCNLSKMQLYKENDLRKDKKTPTNLAHLHNLHWSYPAIQANPHKTSIILCFTRITTRTINLKKNPL